MNAKKRSESQTARIKQLRARFMRLATQLKNLTVSEHREFERAVKKLEQVVGISPADSLVGYWDSVLAVLRETKNEPKTVREISQLLKAKGFGQHLSSHSLRANLHKYFRAWVTSARLLVVKDGQVKRYSLAAEYYRPPKPKSRRVIRAGRRQS